MAGKSQLERVPPGVRDELHRLLNDGATIRELVEYLESVGIATSPSSVGRWRKSITDTMRRHEEAERVAAVWAERFRTDPEGKVGRLLIEMLRTTAYSTVAKMNESEEGADPREIMVLARAFRDLEGAAMVSVEREQKVIAGAARRGRTEATRQGVDAAVWDAIEAKIMGRAA